MADDPANVFVVVKLTWHKK